MSDTKQRQRQIGDAVTQALDRQLPDATWEMVKQAWRDKRYDEAVAMVQNRGKAIRVNGKPIQQMPRVWIEQYIFQSVITEDWFAPDGGNGSYMSYKDDTLLISKAVPKAIVYDQDNKRWVRGRLPIEQWQRVMKGLPTDLTLRPA